MNLAVDITSWIWLALEVGLRVRDRIAHRGSTGRDGATRRTIMVMIGPAVLAATALSYLLPRPARRTQTKRLVPGLW